MATFSNDLINMPVGYRWSQASILNEIIVAIQKRNQSLYGSTGSIGTVSAGVDVQSAAWIRTLQSWIESNYSAFCRPSVDPNKPSYSNNANPKYSEDGGASGFSSDAGLNISSTPSDWWRRKGPGFDTVGAISAGDYIGNWVWQDLARALRAMNIIRDSNPTTLVDTPMDWNLIYVPSPPTNPFAYDYVALRYDTGVQWMNWVFVFQFNFPNSTQAQNTRTSCAYNYNDVGCTYYAPIGEGPPWPQPYDRAAYPNRVWMQTCLTITDDGGLWAVSNRGYGASMSNCYKAVENTINNDWDGTSTRKLFMKAEESGWDYKYFAFGGSPETPTHKTTGFKGGSQFYNPPASGRGGGDAPLTDLQQGWNAVYSKDDTWSAGTTTTKNITDQFDRNFTDWGYCPLSCGTDQIRNYQYGWHAEEVEAYLYTPDY